MADSIAQALDARQMLISHMVARGIDEDAARCILTDYAEVQKQILAKRHNTQFVQQRKGMKTVLAAVGITTEFLQLFQGQLKAEWAADDTAE